jgi:hypothetical protein
VNFFELAQALIKGARPAQATEALLPTMQHLAATGRMPQPELLRAFPNVVGRAATAEDFAPEVVQRLARADSLPDADIVSRLLQGPAGDDPSAMAAFNQAREAAGAQADPLIRYHALQTEIQRQVQQIKQTRTPSFEEQARQVANLDVDPALADLRPTRQLDELLGPAQQRIVHHPAGQAWEDNFPRWDVGDTMPTEDPTEAARGSAAAIQELLNPTEPVLAGEKRGWTGPTFSMQESPVIQELGQDVAKLTLDPAREINQEILPLTEGPLVSANNMKGRMDLSTNFRLEGNDPTQVFEPFDQSSGFPSKLFPNQIPDTRPWAKQRQGQIAELLKTGDETFNPAQMAFLRQQFRAGTMPEGAWDKILATNPELGAELQRVYPTQQRLHALDAGEYGRLPAQDKLDALVSGLPASQQQSVYHAISQYVSPEQMDQLYTKSLFQGPERQAFSDAYRAYDATRGKPAYKEFARKPRDENFDELYDQVGAQLWKHREGGSPESAIVEPLFQGVKDRLSSEGTFSPIQMAQTPQERWSAIQDWYANYGIDNPQEGHQFNQIAYSPRDNRSGATYLSTPTGQSGNPLDTAGTQWARSRQLDQTALDELVSAATTDPQNLAQDLVNQSKNAPSWRQFAQDQLSPLQEQTLAQGGMPTAERQLPAASLETDLEGRAQALKDRIAHVQALESQLASTPEDVISTEGKYRFLDRLKTDTATQAQKLQRHLPQLESQGYDTSSLTLPWEAERQATPIAGDLISPAQQQSWKMQDVSRAGRQVDEGTRTLVDNTLETWLSILKDQKSPRGASQPQLNLLSKIEQQFRTPDWQERLARMQIPVDEAGLPVTSRLTKAELKAQTNQRVAWAKLGASGQFTKNNDPMAKLLDALQKKGAEITPQLVGQLSDQLIHVDPGADRLAIARQLYTLYQKNPELLQPARGQGTTQYTQAQQQAIQRIMAAQPQAPLDTAVTTQATEATQHNLSRLNQVYNR